MNILPLIVALCLILSLLSIEKIEKFKNQTLIQQEMRFFLLKKDRRFFNQRQAKLYGKHEKERKQLSIRFLIDKKSREREAAAALAYRQLILDLMERLYGKAFFYQRIKARRPDVLEELLTAVEQSADRSPEHFLKRTKDISKLSLEDKELQELWYYMLKGSLTREELSERQQKEQIMTPSQEAKAFLSLFYFINNKGAEAVPRIEVQKAPLEILQVIFEGEEVPLAVIKKREELAKAGDSGASAAFEEAFKGHIRPGIDDKLLDFKITKSEKKEYR